VRPRVKVQVLAGTIAIATAVSAVILGPLIGPQLVRLLAPTLANVRGTGEAITEGVPLPAGWARIRWDVDDVQLPTNGCQFGLRLVWLDPPANGVKEAVAVPPGWLAFRHDQLPKLEYRTIAAGGHRSVATIPIEFQAGTYQFIVEGTCGWSVSIDRSEPAAYPSFEPAPRMNVG